ncbi:MAG: TAT-variant-translocated molybdopterin oxidoreductase, partial [Thermoanaerobaculales bacterium]
MRQGTGDRGKRVDVNGNQVSAREARGGREYWRSLDELADTPEYRALVEKEFPGLAEDLLSPQTRRAFLKVMGASLGIAGLASCRWPKELIVPFASRPEGRTPGVPQQYATAMELGGGAVGLLVTSVDGRPIKVEGNPLHPASLGAAGALHQASVLELYDPDRSKQVVHREGGQVFPQNWDEFLAFAVPHFAALRSQGGKSLAVLAEETTSLTAARLRRRFATVFPAAAWYEWEPWSRQNERDGARQAFGRDARAIYRFDHAEVVLCLDADPLAEQPNALRYAREFASRRRGDDGVMARLYAAEPIVSLTGAMADHRLAVSAARIAGILHAIAGELAKVGLALPQLERAVDAPGDEHLAFVQAVSRDLLGHLGHGLVIAGPRQPAAVHALAQQINLALGGVGRVVRFVDAGETAGASHGHAIAALASAARSGQVQTLLILGGNPVYDAPVELDLAGTLASVPTTIHLGLFDDETSRSCRWHVPRAQYLESWGDVRAWDGTVSVQQPLIDALYGGKSAIELLALALGEPSPNGYDLVRATIRELTGAAEFEVAWRRALNDGLLGGSEFAALA